MDVNCVLLIYMICNNFISELLYSTPIKFIGIDSIFNHIDSFHKTNISGILIYVT